ncbi:MAG: ubiquinone biosynthesis protein [Cyanomargarita calcarea GSE-NOS-MK-12-04C]|jgi:ubiquinone biosynthesis protein Coq4|uniref:Ubiquinone biosynthesis protein n=1 Tax=Cyanomargarita calcarea GSE-NOS-MK-12-04C TaxID=2839659 RepID=A0A951QV27_9CYAN|nr:ubiquinone biosynthesis protein [Cyanomargarita calcarea GSE-NOS-MK-12-04C]
MLKRLEELNRTVRNLYSVTDLLKSMGANTDNVFDIEDNFRGSNQMKVCVDRVKAIPEALAMMESRYVGPAIDLEALSQLSRGSLGHTYATVMKALGFDPNFFRQRQIETDEDWLTMRLRKTHDLVHLVTGFGPTGGEVGVLSIQAVQIGYPMSVALQVASIGMALKQQPEKLPDLTQQVARGMGMAMQMKPLIAQRWEDGWDKTLHQWREDLNITDPVIDEPYSLKNRLPDLDLDW